MYVPHNINAILTNNYLQFVKFNKINIAMLTEFDSDAQVVNLFINVSFGNFKIVQWHAVYVTGPQLLYIICTVMYM